MKTPRRHCCRGFTLVEVLVVIVVVAGLAAATLAVTGNLRAKAAEVREVSTMRNLGEALYGWASDHQGMLPRSSHSAVGHGELGWQREILPQLGYPDTGRNTLAKAKPDQFGIDPNESPARTPALNVYFELDPDYDDYEGAPKTWRNFMQVPNPSATILLIEIYGAADHVMAQYFNGKVDGYPAPRAGRDHGCVLWVDGHASMEKKGTVFDSTCGIDRFHPEKAR